MDKDFTRLITYFNKHAHFGSTLIAELPNCFEPFEVHKNEYLIREGEKELYLYFVLEGIQLVGISYLKDDLPAEQIITFTYEEHFSGSFPSLFSNTPSQYFIKAIEYSRFLRIPQQKLLALLEQYMEMNIWVRNASIQLLIGSINREKELLHLSPAQRYEKFIERSTQLVQRVPQKYIASYLGMTPETYSRLRKKQ